MTGRGPAPSRRQLLGGIGLGAGALWVAPTILTVDAASAFTIPPTVPGFVAVGNAPSQQAWVSGTGVNWAASTTQPPGARLLYDVTRIGTRFVGVGFDNGAAGAAWLTTDNGVTWQAATTQPANADSNFHGVANDGTNLVAVGRDTTNVGRAWTSANGGVDWSLAGTPGGLNTPADIFRSVAHGSGIWVVDGSSSGTPLTWWSNDTGATWNDSNASPPLATGLTGITTDGSTWLIAGIINPGTTGQVWESNDSGDNWTATAGQPPSANVLEGVGINGTTWLTCGQDSNNTAAIWRSTDGGVTWTNVFASGDRNVSDLAFDGTRWVAVGETNSSTGAAWVSTDDGQTWTPATIQPSGATALFAVAAP